jgi:glutamate-1-semialdehyde 2,1-aminomutase
LIFDEVVTGFRISKGGAQEYYGITPDLTTLAKILGGGLPGGAVTGKASIINMLETTDDPDHNKSRRIAHNGTFNANPISASAGIAALSILKSEPVNERATEMGTSLKNGLNGLLTKLEIPGCASGVSSLIHLRLGVDHECDGEVCMVNSDRAVNANQNSQLSLALQNHGVHSGNRFIVSSRHTEKDIDDTIIAMEKSLVEVRDQELI